MCSEVRGVVCSEVRGVVCSEVRCLVRGVVCSEVRCLVRGVVCSEVRCLVRGVVCSEVRCLASGLCVRVRGVVWPLGRRLAERCRQATDPASAQRRLQRTQTKRPQRRSVLPGALALRVVARRSTVRVYAQTNAGKVSYAYRFQVMARRPSSGPDASRCVTGCQHKSLSSVCPPASQSLSEATRSADRLAFRKVAKRAVLEVRLCPCLCRAA